jgi:hypothetical protein
MRTIESMGTAALLPLMIALAACSGSHTATDAPGPKRPAHFTYIYDVSTSPATINDSAVIQAVQRRVGDDMMKNVRLGDTITVHEAGGRSADRMLEYQPIVTDYNLRVPAARARLLEQMRAIVARVHSQGGDNATNLLLALESIQPDCASPGSAVTLITDGVEESDVFSAGRALAKGKPVNFPQPTLGRYLAGCRVLFVGFGLTEDPSAGKAELLPARQLSALRQGWTNYLQSAGVHPEDIEFVSAL